MVLKGKLCLSAKNDDYTIFSSGRLTNLSEYLNLMLLEDVRLSITDVYSDAMLLSVQGKLEKRRVQPKYYMYYIDGVDVDSILWGLVGERLKIEVINITKK